jgi:hypothetical protein
MMNDEVMQSAWRREQSANKKNGDPRPLMIEE